MPRSMPPPTCKADRACDSNRACDLIEEQDAVPNIAPKQTRRLATRYVKLAANFLGTMCLAAAIMGWL